jgi:hypothetical protein
MSEQVGDRCAQDDCPECGPCLIHEWELVWMNGDPSEPNEAAMVCKVCGAERTEDL